jgi:protein-tyrosine-phosphatase
MTTRPLSVLFLCTGNSARSQIAEALLRYMSKGSIDAASAGTAPQPRIHPMAQQAVRNLVGIEMTGQYPKLLDQYLHRDFDYVITVCDRAAETCPMFPGDPERIHWGYEDPAAVKGTDDQKQRAFDDVAKQLMSRMRVWMSLPEIRGRIDVALR